MRVIHDDLKLLQLAYRYGYFWQYEETKNVQYSDLDKLDVKHKLTNLALRSWQVADINLVPLNELVYNPSRQIIADGDVPKSGEPSSTRALAGLDRCGMPDHPPPAGVDLSFYGDEDFQGAVESYREFATGSGGWKVGCDPQYPRSHSTRVQVNSRGASAGQKQRLEEVLQHVRKAGLQIGISNRFMIDGSGDHEKYVDFAPIPGSVIGYYYFPTPNSCRRITGRIDSGYAPGTELEANLHLHEECGHGDGLPHTRGGVMNPSILRVWPLTWIGDPSHGLLRRLYGGEPVEPTPPPPSPPPGPGPDPIPGALKLKQLIGHIEGGDTLEMYADGPHIKVTRHKGI